MDKVICIQDGLSKLIDRPHVKRGEIYHIIDTIPHTELDQDEARIANAAPGIWYQFVELPFYHWSGLFEKLEYDEQLEELEQVCNGK